LKSKLLIILIILFISIFTLIPATASTDYCVNDIIFKYFWKIFWALLFLQYKILRISFLMYGFLQIVDLFRQDRDIRVKKKFFADA